MIKSQTKEIKEIIKIVILKGKKQSNKRRLK
jgi:hypothetical protein